MNDGSRADWWADRALRGLIGTMMRLPYRTRVPMMGTALSGAIGPLAGYVRRAERHLHLIYPDMPAPARRRLAKEICNNFGRTVIENFSWQDFGAHLTGTPLTGPGLAPLQQARADSRPVIFVTGHFGNHEAPRHVLTAKGYTIGGLYRPMGNAYFNAHYARK